MVHLRLGALVWLLATINADLGFCQNAPARSNSSKVARHQSLVLNENIDIKWVVDQDRYAWYEAEREGGKSEIVVIDMTDGRRLSSAEFPPGVPNPAPGGSLPAIELQSLAQVERSVNGGPETEIEFINRSEIDIELKWIDSSGKRHSYGRIAKGEQRKQHTFAGHVWLLCNRNGKAIAAVRNEARMVATFMFKPDTWPIPELREADSGRSRRKPAEATDDDVFIRDFNLWKRDSESDSDVPLTSDGNDKHGYEGEIWWSPTKEHFAVMRTRFVEERKVTLVDSTPDDQLQPKTITIGYAKPGDELDHPQLCIFDRDGEKLHEVSEELTPHPFHVQDITWRSDGSAVRFVYNERGHQRLQVMEMSVADGKTRVLVDEKSKTFVDYAGKYYLRFLDSTNELIWMSERDGWNHLYLIDQQTGKVKQKITQGKWVVREVVDVDETARSMLVSVGGFVPGEDPYFVHLLRVSFDGGVPIKLTDGQGQHEWVFSPSKRYFVDRMSRVDMPPKTTLRSLETGREIAVAEVADASQLLDGGWTMPQRVMAIGRDGVTDIHGIVVLPKDFDEEKKYPVLELIYAGPHSAHVPKSFLRLSDLHQAADGVDDKQFIVVRIDGMGTSHRSKAFHDVCWKNLGDAGFPDRILWMKAAAKLIPQMDLDRVGIWGGSAGGQNAMRALIAHGDFYTAAFADCGCHDNRMDKIWWNELWMGYPVASHYEEQSNVIQAHRITGKLMLSVGELDTNVDPASTLQVVDALIKAGKEFELLFFPGAGHGVGSGPYATKRRIDFFRRAFYAN